MSTLTAESAVAKPDTSHIHDTPILYFLAKHQGRWSTWGEGYGWMPTVQQAMPKGTSLRLQVYKMNDLMARGLVIGCGCGCRGDYEITEAGLAVIGHKPDFALLDANSNRQGKKDPGLICDWKADDDITEEDRDIWYREENGEDEGHLR